MTAAAVDLGNGLGAEDDVNRAPEGPGRLPEIPDECIPQRDAFAPHLGRTALADARRDPERAKPAPKKLEPRRGTKASDAGNGRARPLSSMTAAAFENARGRHGRNGLAPARRGQLERVARTGCGTGAAALAGGRDDAERGPIEREGACGTGVGAGGAFCACMPLTHAAARNEANGARHFVPPGLIWAAADASAPPSGAFSTFSALSACLTWWSARRMSTWSMWKPSMLVTSKR